MAHVAVPPSADSNNALRDKLRRIARYHRWVIVAIFTYVTLAIALIVYSMCGGTFETLLKTFLNPFVRAVGLGLLVLAVAAIVLLTKELSNLVVAIVCGVVALAPYGAYSLLPMLLVLHLLATKRLRSHGIKVGLLGADPKHIGSLER
jgi:cytochrome bd-type quinol oxidase subunit 2